MRWIPVALALFTVGCGSEQPGVLERFERMIEQPRAEAYAPSRVFGDGKVMQTPPEGTVPWNAPELARVTTDTRPTMQTLERGRDRFEIICATCHGVRGDGQTPVAAAMEVRRPPSLHSARVRALAAKRVYEVITEGYGLMPSYAAQLDEADRRAVVAYVRALQLSQSARVADLPDDMRHELADQAAHP
jgi:mono/diheme cytochrome c family protein